MTGRRLDGNQLSQYAHICAFFNSPDEKYQVLLPFIKEGIERSEKAIHIMDADLRVDHVRRLENAGINVNASENSGQLEVRYWDDTYLLGGRFDQHRMLAFAEEVLTEIKLQGYPRTRVVANVRWPLEEPSSMNDLVEYEARANLVLPKHQVSGICAYETPRFSASFILDMLRTHPIVILAGIVYENPFYIPPEEFLEELEERRAKATSLEWGPRSAQGGA